MTPNQVDAAVDRRMQQAEDRYVWGWSSFQQYRQAQVDAYAWADQKDAEERAQSNPTK